MAAEPLRTPCVISADDVLTLLSGVQFPLEVEAATQAAVERVLVATFGPAEVSREHRLGPGDIPDFLIGGRIVLEIKGPRHRQAAVQRQLQRYAAYDQVEAIVLATSRAMFMPGTLASRVDARRVPVGLLNFGRAWL